MAEPVFDEPQVTCSMTVTSVSVRPQVRVCSRMLIFNDNFSDYLDISDAETSKIVDFTATNAV